MKSPVVLFFLTLFAVLALFLIALPDRVAAAETSTAATGDVSAINGQSIPLVGETGFYVFIGIILFALAGLLIFSMRKERTPPVN